MVPPNAACRQTSDAHNCLWTVGLSYIVVLESSYEKHISKDEKDLKSGVLGIGNLCTWHGVPDMRVRGFLFTL